MKGNYPVLTHLLVSSGAAAREAYDLWAQGTRFTRLKVDGVEVEYHLRQRLPTKLYLDPQRAGDVVHEFHVNRGERLVQGSNAYRLFRLWLAGDRNLNFLGAPYVITHIDPPELDTF